MGTLRRGERIDTPAALPPHRTTAEVGQAGRAGGAGREKSAELERGGAEGAGLEGRGRGGSGRDRLNGKGAEGRTHQVDMTAEAALRTSNVTKSHSDGRYGTNGTRTKRDATTTHANCRTEQQQLSTRPLTQHNNTATHMFSSPQTASGARMTSLGRFTDVTNQSRPSLTPQ